MRRFCVIGSGMAGYGAAHRLTEAGKEPVIFERRGHWGGHTASYVYENRYTYDDAPHATFSNSERVKKILADAIDSKYEKLDTKVNNYWKGHWIKHPAQVNLYGLPTELVVKLIADFVTAQ